MSTLKLSDLRDLCKEPNDSGKVVDFLRENPGMDLIGEGHGGSIRAAINSNNPEAIKALLHYHRSHQMDIYEVGTGKYNEALSEFKQVFDEILAENWNFIKEKYIFSDEVKQALEEEHVLPDEDNEQDFVSDEEDASASSLDCDFDSTHLEDTMHNSAHNKLPSGETHHYSTEMC